MNEQLIPVTAARNGNFFEGEQKAVIDVTSAAASVLPSTALMQNAAGEMLTKYYRSPLEEERR